MAKAKRTKKKAGKKKKVVARKAVKAKKPSGKKAAAKPARRASAAKPKAKAAASQHTNKTRFVIIDTAGEVSLFATPVMTKRIRNDVKSGRLHVIDCERVLSMTPKNAWAKMAEYEATPEPVSQLTLDQGPAEPPTSADDPASSLFAIDSAEPPADDEESADDGVDSDANDTDDEIEGDEALDDAEDEGEDEPSPLESDDGERPHAS